MKSLITISIALTIIIGALNSAAQSLTSMEHTLKIVSMKGGK